MFWKNETIGYTLVVRTLPCLLLIGLSSGATTAYWHRHTQDLAKVAIDEEKRQSTSDNSVGSAVCALMEFIESSNFLTDRVDSAEEAGIITDNFRQYNIRKVSIGESSSIYVTGQNGDGTLINAYVDRAKKKIYLTAHFENNSSWEDEYNPVFKKLGWGVDAIFGGDLIVFSKTLNEGVQKQQNDGTAHDNQPLSPPASSNNTHTQNPTQPHLAQSPVIASPQPQAPGSKLELEKTDEPKLSPGHSEKLEAPPAPSIQQKKVEAPQSENSDDVEGF